MFFIRFSADATRSPDFSDFRCTDLRSLAIACICTYIISRWAAVISGKRQTK